jgi:hypothetical protein
MSTRRQKGKGMKRLPGWHQSGYGPDKRWKIAEKRLDRAIARAKVR